MFKKILLGLVALIVIAALGFGAFVFSKVSAFDESMAKVYEIEPTTIEVPDLSSVAFDKYQPPAAPPAGEEEAPGEVDKAAFEAALEQKRLRAVWERGQHLAKSLGGCTACHGDDLATPTPDLDMGPVGKLIPSNITMGGALKNYSDGQLHRALTHGVKHDGTAIAFMDVNEWRWWPDEDFAALIGYLRSVPPAEKEVAPTTIGVLGKVLDQTDKMVIDVARRLDHAAPRPKAPAPEVSAAYGGFVSKLCIGCHGETYSGGPIHGAPPDLVVPANITMHKTGIAHYDFAKFDALMRTGVKPDGSKLDPFMPIKATSELSETEMKALWAFLETAPKKPFGGR